MWVDWVLLKNSRKEVTVTLNSEKCCSFLKITYKAQSYIRMTYFRIVYIVMMQMLRITPTALDSRVSVMQSVEDGGEVETSMVVEDLVDLVVGENE